MKLEYSCKRLYVFIRAADLDYVMWVDADLIFLDMGLRLEQVASAHPGAHVILSAGGSGKGV